MFKRWAKKLKRLVILRLNVNFIAIDTHNIQISSIASSGEQNYIYHDDYIINPLCVMLPKTSVYVKSYYGETKWMYVLIEDNDLLKKNMIFGIKLAILWKKT